MTLPIQIGHGANLNDYLYPIVLIQGDVDCGVACCDRQGANVYCNESTAPPMTVNGQSAGLYLDGCRGGIVREGQGASFWVFVQSFDGTSALHLTRIAFQGNAGGQPVTFIETTLDLSISNYTTGSPRWCSDATVIFAAGLSIYKFSPQTQTATAIFTAASGDPSFADGTLLHISNLVNNQILAFTSNHIYLLNALTGAVLASWAISAFGLTANTLTQCQFDGGDTAWVIAAPGSDVYALSLTAATKTALTSGTDYSSYNLVYNSVKQLLGLLAFNVTTFTTIAVPGGAINTGTLPAGPTFALAVDDDGYFYTADNFAVDLATPTWKIDPVSLTVVLIIGYRHFGGSSIPADDCPRGGSYGFALIPLSPPGNGALINDLSGLNNWCRANGISVALCQDSQRTAKDLLDELFTVGNSAPVYSGDILKVIPYDEVSGAGAGAIYIAPTASGPVANLGDQDFVMDKAGKAPPVRFTRKRRASCDNIVAIEHIDRSLDYMHNVTTAVDQVHVALYGPRKGGSFDASELGLNVPSGSKSFLSISQAAVAQAIASILAKRGAAGVNQYEFTLKAEWAMLLEAMDLVTITDTRLGLNQVPVRLTSVKENSNRELECAADAFIYGLNHPAVQSTTAATGSQILADVDPGLVNAPIIFEPPAGMLPEGSGPQVWMLISGADPNYGGCVVNASVDGGSTYQPLSNAAPATSGVLTADYPVGADPDTTDTLAVDLTESNGALSTQSQQIADGFADPCFVAGASGFEAVCPTAATLTSAFHYSLGTYVRRGVEGTAIMDHPLGSRFAAIDGSTVKINLPAQWVGKTIHLKFQAFNKLGGQLNSLSECVDYTFTPVSTFLPGGFYVNGS